MLLSPGVLPGRIGTDEGGRNQGVPSKGSESEKKKKKKNKKHTEPVVNPDVGKTIPDQQVEPAIGGTDIVQTSTGEEETQIAQGNQLGILGLITEGWRG